MQIGIDLPSVGESIDQRVCTAFGMLREQDPALTSITRELLAFICLTPVRNMRELRKVVDSQPVTGGVASLRSEDRSELVKLVAPLDAPEQPIEFLT